MIHHFRVQSSVGSSPRARGTREVEGRDTHVLRIIPASAGNTILIGFGLRTKPDHPRERGEHYMWRCLFWPGSGSSPASAGNTPSRSRRGSPRPDHPRERGEHRNQPLQNCTHFGSSPRARGTQLGSTTARYFGRIIPASAGNTKPARWTSPRMSDHPRERGEHDHPAGSAGT